MAPEAGSDSSPVAAEGSVDALARFLARRIDRQGQSREDPFTVAELRRELVPYPLCRDVLDFATKAEYDVAFLRLLDDPTLMTSRDPELAEAVEDELASPEPGLAFLGDFAASLLVLEERMREMEGGLPEGASGPAEETAAGETPAAAPDPDPADAGREGSASAAPAEGSPGAPAPSRGEPADAAAPDAPPATCPACAADLPVREDLRFCPHCGQDLVSPACPACGAEMEPGWSYCPACGEASP